MKALSGGIRNVAKLGVLAGTIAIAALGLGQEQPRASAADAEMFISYSTTESIAMAEPTIILYPNGQRDVYVWVDGVSDPTGASAFQVELTFNSPLFSVTSIVPDSLWLAESGRQVSCSPPPVIEPTRAYFECITLSVPPPYGPQGKGMLATVTLQAGPDRGAALLDLQGSFLINTPLDPNDWSYIPLKLRSPMVLLLNCADFDGDGRVTLAGDILAVILRWQMTSSDPDWDPKYDLDDSGSIDLANDILGTILQYQQQCTQSP